MLPGLVLDTTGPDHLSVRETAEMADRRTASAAVTFREKEFVLGMLRPSTTWWRGKSGAALTEASVLVPSQRDHSSIATPIPEASAYARVRHAYRNWVEWLQCLMVSKQKAPLGTGLEFRKGCAAW